MCLLLSNFYQDETCKTEQQNTLNVAFSEEKLTMLDRIKAIFSLYVQKTGKERLLAVCLFFG